MKISFIINSKSRRIDELVSEIRENQNALIKSSRINMTEYPGHARELAKKLAPETDLIIAVGGDGTLHEVVNGVMHSSTNKEKRPGLGLLPRGSANDFARIQKIPGDLSSLIRAIENNSFMKIDLGRINNLKENSTHYFVNVADSGIGAEVVKRMESRKIFRKIISSDLRFAIAILQTFILYKRKSVEILIDGEMLENMRILTLVVANSKAFGSGLIIAPDAIINDGKFQILVGDISLWGYLANLGRLLKGRRLTIKGVQYLEAAKVRISGPKNLFTEADGELIGCGSLEIECLHQAISFYFPLKPSL